MTVVLNPFPLPPHRMCNSAAKLYMEAERCFVVGDHERSYVLFGKYFKTILPLKKRDDYRRQKGELDAILGPQSKQLRAIEIMSELRDNLVDRYSKTKTKDPALQETPSMHTPLDNVVVPDLADSKCQCLIICIIYSQQRCFRNRKILFRPPGRSAAQPRHPVDRLSVS